MADFYSEMAKVAAQLVSPTDSGGLGTGSVVLSRTTPGAPDPSEPWLPTTPAVAKEELDAAVFGVSSEMVGTEAGSAVIQRSDRYAICTVPAMGYESGDTLTVDGQPVTILSVKPIPAAGIASAIRFVIRG